VNVVVGPEKAENLWIKLFKVMITYAEYMDANLDLIAREECRLD
jgi:hypothetical protein